MLTHPSQALLSNALRILAMDAVENANSGHPGMPLGMADVATVLFSQFLTFNPLDDQWPNRDRFVLSAGHGCLLLYSLLYLTGYPSMTLDQLRSFRQLSSHTPGHPEHGPGIEATTGPLGQGLANAVGMALAEKMMSAEFDFVDHRTYAFVGDGCLMEGVSQEAITLAGHWNLNKLIVFFDNNGITIDGPTSLSTSEDTLARFHACGWATFDIDGHDFKAIEEAIRQAQHQDKPALISCRTRIGYGAPSKGGTAAVHGSPLGQEEVQAARVFLEWPSTEPFFVPEHIVQEWRHRGTLHQSTCEQWYKTVHAHPLKDQFWAHLTKEGNVDSVLTPLKERYAQQKPKQATRKSSGEVLKAVQGVLPFVMGSADLAESTQVLPCNTLFSSQHRQGRYVHYGVREHAMAAIMNGIALHGGFIPCGGTFLVFSDYCRPAIRLSALMELQVIYVMTHDSIGLGEDGPTHQPIEHLAALRAIPNLCVFRPCDAVETVECFEVALSLPKTPSVMCLTRQAVETLRESCSAESLCSKGAYILQDDEQPQVDLWATGSEVSLACEVRVLLTQKGIRARVVSFPSWFLFDRQPKSYQDTLLKASTFKVAIEAASPMGWHRYVGSQGLVIGIDHFGASAPCSQLYQAFGFMPQEIAKKIEGALGG
jgi:transketolase